MTRAFKLTLAFAALAAIGIFAAISSIGRGRRRAASWPVELGPRDAASPPPPVLGVRTFESVIVVLRDAKPIDVKLTLSNPSGARRTLTVDRQWRAVCEAAFCTIKFSSGPVTLELDDGCLAASSWTLAPGPYVLEAEGKRAFFDETRAYSNLGLSNNGNKRWAVAGPLLPMHGFDDILTDPPETLSVEAKTTDILVHASRRHLGILTTYKKAAHCEVRGRSFLTTLEDGTWAVQSMDSPGLASAAIWLLAPQPNATLSVDGEAVGVVGPRPRRLLLPGGEHTLAYGNDAKTVTVAAQSLSLFAPNHHWTVRMDRRDYGESFLPVRFSAPRFEPITVRPPSFSSIPTDLAFEDYPATWPAFLSATVRRTSPGTAGDWRPAAARELATLRERAKRVRDASARSELTELLNADEAGAIDDCVLDAIKSAFNQQPTGPHLTTTGWCAPVAK